MPEWPEELMAGLDGRRPLPAALRARLEQALATQAQSPRPLDDALSARLEDALADPLAAALADVERPRSLRPAARRRMERALGVRTRSRLPGAAVAAGILVVAGVSLGLALTGTGTGPSAGSRSALPSVHSGTAGTRASAPAPTGTAPLSASGTASSGSATAVQPQAASGLAANTAAQPVVPVIGAVDPTSGPTAGGNWVTVTGTGMAGATAVEFGTSPAQFVVVSGTDVRALAPAHAPGAVDVRVSTPRGTSAPDPADHYTYG